MALNFINRRNQNFSKVLVFIAFKGIKLLKFAVIGIEY